MGDALAIGEYHALGRPAVGADDWARVLAHYTRLGLGLAQLETMFGPLGRAVLEGEPGAMSMRRNMRAAWDASVLNGIGERELLKLGELLEGRADSRRRPRWDHRPAAAEAPKDTEEV
jgi:hypothetical protein